MGKTIAGVPKRHPVQIDRHCTNYVIAVHGTSDYNQAFRIKILYKEARQANSPYVLVDPREAVSY